VFISPRGRVAQLYPWAPDTHFSRLLRHAWVTVGLFLFPGHHTGTEKHLDELNYFTSNWTLHSFARVAELFGHINLENIGVCVPNTCQAE
jgi:hypothetical protein